MYTFINTLNPSFRSVIHFQVNKIREASISGKAAEERDAREKELISLRQVICQQGL